MKLLSGKNIDLSHINNLSELDTEIFRVKKRIQTSEKIIKTDAKKIPVETIKSTLGAVLPRFATAKAADEAFGAVQTLAGGIVASFFNAKRNGTTFTQGVADTFRQIGFVGTVKAIFQLIRGRKKKAPFTKSANK
ncbi:MAG: hypothetical protein PW786_14490 [Arachidicoccus sp.]|nr:hypothetical protein [Arachidicoccus sp.]